MKTFKQFQAEGAVKTAIKIAAPFVGLGLLGQFGKKKPIDKPRNNFQMDRKLKQLSGTGDSPDARNMLGIPLDYKITPEEKKKYNFR